MSAGWLDGLPEELPPEREYPIMLTRDDAEIIVDGLRGWVHHQVTEDAQTAAQTPSRTQTRGQTTWPR